MLVIIINVFALDFPVLRTEAAETCVPAGWRFCAAEMAPLSAQAKRQCSVAQVQPSACAGDCLSKQAAALSCLMRCPILCSICVLEESGVLPHLEVEGSEVTFDAVLDAAAVPPRHALVPLLLVPAELLLFQRWWEACRSVWMHSAVTCA